MSDLVLDAAVADKLAAIAEPVNLRQPSGRVVGTFHPFKLDLSEWEPLDPNEPEVTDEELLRLLMSDEPRYTTAEVIHHLESLCRHYARVI